VGTLFIMQYHSTLLIIPHNKVTTPVKAKNVWMIATNVTWVNWHVATGVLSLLFQELTRCLQSHHSELGMTQQINNLDAGKWYCNWTRELKFFQYMKKCTYHSISRVHLLK